MPQLMPLYWVFSSFVVFLFFFLMVLLYNEFNVMMFFFSKGEVVEMKSWLW